MHKTKQFFLNKKEGRKATYKIYLGVIFSLTFLFLFSLVSSLPNSNSNPLGYYNPNLPNINQPDTTTSTGGGTTNNYYNVTQNATVNETQFDSNNPISIKESWLTSFIDYLINLFWNTEKDNYLNKTEIQDNYYNITEVYNKTEIDDMNFSTDVNVVEQDPIAVRNRGSSGRSSAKVPVAGENIVITPTIPLKNITLNLANGKNLIGISSMNFIDLYESNVKVNGTLSYQEAKNSGLILGVYDTLADLNENTTLQTTVLIPNNAYWIVTSAVTNITFQNIGGDNLGVEISLVNTFFTDGVLVKNISEAVGAGWLNASSMNSVFYYWNETTANPDERWKTLSEVICDPDFPDQCSGGPDYFESWRGYFTKGQVPNVSMFFSNGTSNSSLIKLNQGWNGFGFIMDDQTPSYNFSSSGGSGSVSVNSTQFEDDNPITINQTWLETFISNISKWASYWNKSENITGVDYIQTTSINFSGGAVYYNGTDNIWDFS
jgi:hypothetical protein